MLEFENKEVVNEFLEETLSGFDTVSNTLIQLESEPENLELIDTIFRPIHSLKGNSAYFGLMKVTKMAHNLENLLDSARKEKLIINSQVISVLLSSIDYLKLMIKRVENDEDEIDDEVIYSFQLTEIDKILQELEKPFQISQQNKIKILELIDQIKMESNESNQTKISELLTFFTCEKKTGKDEHNDSNVSILHELFTKPFIDGYASEEEIARMNELINNLSSQCKNRKATELFNKLQDAFETFAFSGIGIDEVAQEILKETLDDLSKNIIIDENIKQEKMSGSDSIMQKTQNKQKKSKKPEKKKIESTIRIKEKSLDDFLNYVAELLNVEELFKFISTQIAKYDLDLSSSFKYNLDDFSRISAKLRNSIMNIREVDASTLLQKVPRLVRDISNKSDKEINVVITGEDIKIDKSYIELLDNPLVHMVRNAADHGIESMAERSKAGKEEKGNIYVSIFEEDKDFILEVKDDGKGLNLLALNAKAIEMGLIKKGEEMSQDEIIKFLFQSGISTAQKVTDVSGRGVGMDVVKTAIESANGKITVQTKEGEGSVFSIILPKNVSTKINEVYLVESFSNEVYALPLKIIEEAFTADFDKVFSIIEKGNVLKRRENLLSVLVLDDILGVSNKSLNAYFDNDNKVSFVYINLPYKSLALCVKTIVGVQTIVVKDIIGLQMNKNIFDGGATMGDGKIALQIKQEYLQNYIN